MFWNIGAYYHYFIVKINRFTDFLVFEIEENMNVLEPNIEKVEKIIEMRQSITEKK